MKTDQKIRVIPFSRRRYSDLFTCTSGQYCRLCVSGVEKITGIDVRHHQDYQLNLSVATYAPKKKGWKKVRRTGFARYRVSNRAFDTFADACYLQESLKLPETFWIKMEVSNA